MIKAKVEFLTDAYRRSHGKQPRGNGSWAFHITEGAYRKLMDSGINIPNVTITRTLTRPCIFTHGGTHSLAEAKAMVKLLFDASGIGGEWYVEVAP